MARVHIHFPDRSVFSTQLTVRISDINYGNHLGNDALLSMLHEARIRFLTALHYTEFDVEGAGLIMADAAIQYKAEAFHGDVLCIDIAVDSFSRAGFDMLYKVRNGIKIIALAKTGMVFFDYEKRKILYVPEAFKEKLLL